MNKLAPRIGGATVAHDSVPPRVPQWPSPVVSVTRVNYGAVTSARMLTVVKMDGATKDNVSVLLDSLAIIATISANRVNGAIIVVKNVTVAKIRHVIT